MQDQLEIVTTETGTRYILPLRQSALFKKLGLGLIGFSLLLTVMLYFQAKIMGGSGLLSDVWLVAGMGFTAFCAYGGFRLFTNRTYQEVELKDNFLICREMLFPKFGWGLKLRCNAAEVTSLTVDSVDRMVDQFKKIPGLEWLEGTSQAKSKLKVVHAMSGAGREMSFAHFYPVEVVNDLAEALLSRLGAIAVPEGESFSHGIEVVELRNCVRYVLPYRKLGFSRYFAIIPIVATGLILLQLVPGLLACLKGGIVEFLVFSVALLLPICICALVFGLGLRVLRNFTRQEIELRDGQVFCYENIFTRFLRVNSKCKASEIESLEVQAFEPECLEHGPSKFLANFVSDAYFGKVQTSAGSLIVGKAYPYDTVRFLVDDIQTRIGLDNGENQLGAEDVDSVEPVSSVPPLPVVDMGIVPGSHVQL